jgi:hypothetical protein
VDDWLLLSALLLSLLSALSLLCGAALCSDLLLCSAAVLLLLGCCYFMYNTHKIDQKKAKTKR